MSANKKRMPVISLTIFFLILLSTGLSGYYVWLGLKSGFDKVLPILASCLLMDGLGVFALVFKVSFETRKRAMTPFICSLLLLAVCSIHLAALANMRTGAISRDEEDTRTKTLEDDRHARDVRDANALVELNCSSCSPERKRRMYQSEMARLEKAENGKNPQMRDSTEIGEKSWGRRYVEDYATAVQLIFGLLCGLAMLVNNFVRLYADEPANEFPNEIEVKNRLPIKRENLRAQKETQRTIDSFDSAKYAAGAQALRDALKDISFRLKGYSFKVTVKPDSVWIMMVEAVQGTQQTVSSCRCELAILRDAETMPRDKFARKLELTLKRGGFEI